MPVNSAIGKWITLLGAERVITDTNPLMEPYTRAACGSTRSSPCVLKPTSPEEVQQIVRIAREYKAPLYPISCGKQWGMGSRLPVKDGAAIIDLSGMTRILEINEQHHYAVVEPGVTQRQLTDHLKEQGLKLRLNVTGSTSDTSLIGNAMDRGVGYFDSRAHGISNMHIILGSGEQLNTGFGHYENARTKNLYPYGVGPDLTGLFPQGNFGIVTSACIDLMPEPEAHVSAIIAIDSTDKLPRLIDELVQLRTQGIITTVAHIGNHERSFISLAPLLYSQLIENGNPPGAALRAQAEKMLAAGGFSEWTAAIGVLGTKPQLKLAKKRIRKAVSGFAKTMFLNDQIIRTAKAISAKLSFIPYVQTQRMILLAVEPIYGLTRGETTDMSLKGVYWSANDFDQLDNPNPDQSNSGVLFCLPIYPADGQTVCDSVRDTSETFARHGFEAAITVNLMSSKAMEGVVSLAFDRRNPEQTQAAHDCIQEMEARYMKQGFPPYRVGINSMHHVVTENDPFWQTVRSLKTVFDPDNIIAPGRYNLL